jgi:SAM-dependent methyltransferase
MTKQASAQELSGRHRNLASGRLPVVEGTDAVERIHIARYEFALAYAGQKSVLDVATGIGYGAHLLASRGAAASVTGVDISEEAIRTACERYRHPALHYRLIVPGPLPFADDSFDTVVSFETIEHTADPALFLREIRRVLRPGGELVISTPNKRFHSFGRRTPWNPHHAFELYPGAFDALLTEHFGPPTFRGGQEFVAVTPATVLQTNWVEFRYYRLLGRPAYTALHGLLSRAAHPVRGAGTGDQPACTPVIAAASDRSVIVPWREGCEPYTMIAVCRKPGTGG